MRKLMFLSMILFLGMGLFLTADPLTLDYGFTIAYLPLESLYQSTGSYNASENKKLCFYADFNTRIYFLDFLFFGGDMRCNFYKNNIDFIYFVPDMMTFKFSTGLKFSNFEIGFNHYCLHPVIPYFNQQQNIKVLFEGAYEEIYIKFSSTTKNKS